MQAALEEFGWAVAPNPREHDLGTDLWVSPRDHRRFDLGLMLGIQVKNGKSEFDELRTVSGAAGWWFRDSREHFEYWLHHAVPHVVVLRDPRTAQAFWVHINETSVRWTGKGGKVFVPERQILDATALAPLTEIAASTRPTPRWAGSAWTGAPDLAPADLMRHALVAPRLVAPHPNLGERELKAHEAVALVTAGRFRELDRYGLLDPGSSRTAWAWTFFEAILKFATSGTAGLLAACVRDSAQTHDRAAATAALAAALVEAGAHEQALAALDEVLDADDFSPIDHAWLQVHRARSLAEIGETARAIDLAITVQGLPALWPQDVTVAAIAGTGANLVFRTSDLFSGDIASTISAGDTETSWWRAQATSWALGSLFDESFRRWNPNENEVKFGGDDGSGRLRGVSLVAGFSAQHETWCYATSVLAKSELMSENLPGDQASDCLTDLRRAGDAKAVKAGVAHLLASGPAVAVTLAAGRIEMDQLTHTEASASIELIVRGADVLRDDSADAVARWAMQTEVQLAPWVTRVRPRFIMEYKRAEILGALVPAVSSALRAQIRDHVIALPPLADQGAAHAWAAVMRQIPVADWTADEVRRLSARSSDNWEFENALKPALIQKDVDAARRHEDQLRSGDLQALAWAGPITSVPQDAVPALATAAGGAIRERLAQVRTGTYAAYGGVDPGRALVLLNMHFPGAADWAPIVELLSEPLASHHMLKGVLEPLQWSANKIDEPARSEVADALAAMTVRQPSLTIPMLGGDARAAAAGALEALRPAEIAPSRWLTARDVESRLELIKTLARRADPRDREALMAFAGDPNPRIRGGAAAALTYWASHGVSTAKAMAALRELLADPGTLVARHIISAWPDQRNQHVRSLAEALASHASARVRSAAAEVLGGDSDPHSRR